MKTMKQYFKEENKLSRKVYGKPYLSLKPEQKSIIKLKIINMHLKKDIKESERSIKEDKELEKTLGRMM